MSQLIATESPITHSGTKSAPALKADQPSAVAKWTGRTISGLVAAFLLLDAVMKLIKPEVVVKSTLELGYPESTIVGIGIALLASTLLYIFPRTAVLGAILLTAYLGGAVATHVRVQAPQVVFNIAFSVTFGILVWVGLLLRNKRLQALLPLTKA